MARRFTGNFTQQEPISDAAIEAAVAVLKHGRLHRYNLADGEAGETALLEREFATMKKMVEGLVRGQQDNSTPLFSPSAAQPAASDTRPGRSR